MSPGVPDSPRLGVEPLVTTHRLIAAFDRDARGLEWLHGDLFDSRPRVALSAMEAVAALANPASFPYVTRVLASGGAGAHRCRRTGPGQDPSPRLRPRLGGHAEDDAGGRPAPGDPGRIWPPRFPRTASLRALCARLPASPMAPAGARAHAVGLLLSLRGEAVLDELLEDSREETVDQVLRSAGETPALVEKAVERYAPQYKHLPARTRAALVSLALTQDLAPTGDVLREALVDPVADVRRAAYAGIATAAHHAKLFPMVIECLLGQGGRQRRPGGRGPRDRGSDGQDRADHRRHPGRPSAAG